MDILLALIAEYDAFSYWKRTETTDERPCRVFIVYDGGPKSEGGFYQWSAGDPDACIRIGRPGISPEDPRTAEEIAATADDPTRELLVLAHELGHHHSRLRGSYVPFQLNHPLPTYAEEVRAWEIGRRILVTKGFQDWMRFESHSRAQLLTYSEGLGLDAVAAAAADGEERAVLGDWWPAGCVG
jgi:hypothetical protein